MNSETVSRVCDEWCPGPELDRYVSFETRDFKSSARFSVALSSLAFAMSCGFHRVAIHALS
jgi:hypothetical protein